MDLAGKRRLLLEDLRRRVRDERVLQAMAEVDRRAFVPDYLADQAYDDAPLPIGAGQSISQPLMVALMTEALALQGTERVLEVGTGSGYQAAILARLAAHVVTVERIPALAARARARLRALGIGNVEVHVAGDQLGWPAGAPYDAIIVTAAAPQVPQALLDQLVLGGRLVIPTGPLDHQDLLVVTKQADGTIRRQSLGGCRFVPLIGEQAFPPDVAQRD